MKTIEIPHAHTIDVFLLTLFFIVAVIVHLPFFCFQFHLHFYFYAFFLFFGNGWMVKIILKFTPDECFVAIFYFVTRCSAHVIF